MANGDQQPNRLALLGQVLSLTGAGLRDPGAPIRFAQFQQEQEQNQQLLQQRQAQQDFENQIALGKGGFQPVPTGPLPEDQAGLQSITPPGSDQRFVRTPSNDFAQFQQILGGQQQFAPGTTISVDTPFGKVTTPLNRKFTQGELKDLTNAEALEGQIDTLVDIISKDTEKPLTQKSQFKGLFPAQLGDEEAQRLSITQTDLADRLLRLRSGAQINQSEFKRFQKLLPKITRKDKIDIEQLNRFKSEFSKIRGRIQSGAVFDEQKKEFVLPDGSKASKKTPKSKNLTQKDISQMSDDELKALIGE